MMQTMTTVSRRGAGRRLRLMLAAFSLAGFLSGCDWQGQETVAQSPATGAAGMTADTPAAAPAAAGGRMEKGVFFRPELSDYQLHNEYDDDGDGDGIKETHVRRYINANEDSAFSMTTNGILWAWSLDTKGDDDADIHNNYVVRDSNCDKVFDERYSLDAEFHVPPCTVEGGTAEKPGGI